MPLTQSLTYKWRSISCAGKQVVHNEQENGVTQDQGHFEGGPIHTVGGQVEGQNVNEHKEGARDQQVDHVEHWAPPYDHLMDKRKTVSLKCANLNLCTFTHLWF